MNLYDYYNEPEELYNYHVADNDTPEIFWKGYALNSDKILKRKKAILKSPHYSYLVIVLHPEIKQAQEFIDVVATDPKFAVQYASHVLDYSRFPEGEKTIATSAKDSYMYALNIIEGRWKMGEKVIASNPEYKQKYYRFTGVKL